ncbi:complement factor H-related protein 4-like [Channa argus]|uniref:complement factor H-related protein 4-like n=1 Tax=Channa argus TaxID=215402 RepID=UPI003522C8D8
MAPNLKTKLYICGCVITLGGPCRCPLSLPEGSSCTQTEEFCSENSVGQSSMHPSLILLFLHLWGNVGLSLSQNACSQLPDVPHAQVAEETKKAEYQEGDVIRFTCNSGYISHKPSKFVCTRGSWLAVSRGSCYSCSQLPVVPHAQVSEDTRKDGYQLGDVIHFTCEAGYTSDLTLKYVCLMQGWLEVHYGKCYFQASGCEPPPADGHLTITGLPENHEPMLPDHVLVFSCDDPGKYMNGSSVLICGKDGQWNHPFPSCKAAVKCKVPEIEHGTVTGDITDYNEHEILYFECNATYRKSEERPSRCTEIVDWSPTPTCEPDKNMLNYCYKLTENVLNSPTTAAIKCKLEVSQLEGFRYEPAHRNVFSPGETLRVTCKKRDWILNRSTVITCRDDGQWTSDPTCKAAVKCKVPEIEHGTVTGDITYYNEDEILHFECNATYGKPEVRPSRCTEIGQTVEWSPTPRCEPIKCKLEVSQLEGFRYDPPHRNVFSPGEILRVTCKKRHWIFNRSTVITCRDDGQWTSDPTCKAVKCKVPQIEHGTVTGDIRDYNEHEILHFECNARYGKTEERPSKCTKIGQRADWSPTPTCEPIKCRLEVSQLEGFTYEPAHRNEFSPGETLRVTFEEKYWIFTPLENSTVVTCRDDGQWTSEPILKEVTCSRPNDQHISYWENDYQQKKTLGDTVRYSCTSGYKSTNGTTRATCTGDGWTPDPLCQAPSGCGKPPPLTDGDTRFTSKYEYNHNDRVEYVCKNYYTMRGGPFKICNNGDWTGNITCLRPCTVDKEIMLKHNIAFLYSGEEKLYSPHQTYITFRCTGRTRHVGTVSMRQQCIDGVISLPTCQ